MPPSKHGPTCIRTTSSPTSIVNKPRCIDRTASKPCRYMGFYPHMYAEQCTKKFLHTHLGHMLLLHTRWNDPHLQLLVVVSLQPLQHLASANPVIVLHCCTSSLPNFHRASAGNIRRTSLELQVFTWSRVGVRAVQFEVSKTSREPHEGVLAHAPGREAPERISLASRKSPHGPGALRSDG